MLFTFSNNTNSTHGSINSSTISLRTIQNKRRSLALECPKTIHNLVQTVLKQSQHFSTQSQHFSTQSHSVGLKHMAISAPTIATIWMALSQRLNQVGEKLLPLGVCQNFPIPVSMRSSICEDKLSLLLHLKPPV